MPLWPFAAHSARRCTNIAGSSTPWSLMDSSMRRGRTNGTKTDRRSVIGQYAHDGETPVCFVLLGNSEDSSMVVKQKFTSGECSLNFSLGQYRAAYEATQECPARTRSRVRRISVKHRNDIVRLNSMQRYGRTKLERYCRLHRRPSNAVGCTVVTRLRTERIWRGATAWYSDTSWMMTLPCIQDRCDQRLYPVATYALRRERRECCLDLPWDVADSRPL